MPTFNAIIGYKIRDERGKHKWFSENAEVTFTDVTDLKNLVHAVGEDIDAPISGRVVETKIELYLGAPSGVKSAPQAGSSVSEGARIGMKDSNGGINGVYVPTLTSVARYVDGETLNLNDVEVSNLVARLLSGANTQNTASFDFQDDDRRKYEPFDANNDAAYGTYATRKPQ